jgi:hypothetical protein
MDSPILPHQGFSGAGHPRDVSAQLTLNARTGLSSTLRQESLTSLPAYHISSNLKEYAWSEEDREPLVSYALEPIRGTSKYVITYLMGKRNTRGSGICKRVGGRFLLAFCSEGQQRSVLPLQQVRTQAGGVQESNQMCNRLEGSPPRRMYEQRQPEVPGVRRFTHGVRLGVQAAPVALPRRRKAEVQCEAGSEEACRRRGHGSHSTGKPD